MTDEDKLNHLIAASQIELKEPRYGDWFTRGHQKKLIFNLAAKIFTENEIEPAEAIQDATDFVDTFYQMKVNPETRK